MKIIFHCVCLLALGFAGSAFAQPITVRQTDQIDILNHTPPQVYQGQMVISVRTTSQAQLDAMLALTESVWTENTGVGPLDIQIKRSNLNAITALGIPHDVLIEDLQAHTNTNWNRLVEIERQEQKAQGTNQGQRGGGVHDDVWFANYKQLFRITDYIDNIVAFRPDMASTSIIGQSYEGRAMIAITISAPDTIENPLADRPVIFIFSTVHAREWIAPMTTVYFASKFVEDYDTDPRVQAILDSARIVIVPVGNPDGYLYTWSDYRYWRKTRRANTNGTFGVDINRNWGYEWGGQGASDDPGDNTYHGTAPFSEPETANLRDAALSYGDQLIAHMEYHSYSQLVMYPWGYSRSVEAPEPDRTFFELISNEVATEIDSVHGSRYIPQQSSDLYSHAGNSPDWFYGELGIPSMLIELRPANSDFNPPPSNILPNAQENYAGILRYIERILEPISFWHTNYPTYPSQYGIRLRVTAIDARETIDPESLTLYSRIGASNSFEPTSMLRDGLADYFVDFEPLPCGDFLEYYFQAATTDGNTYTYPVEGAQSPYTMESEEFVTSYLDDLELDTGWIVGSDTDTATAGIWTRMDPEGTPAQPENDHTPHGTMCWVTDGIAGTDQDDRDVDGGFTTLTSPMFDATLFDETYISFWMWLTQLGSGNDFLLIELSNDNAITWLSLGYFGFGNQQWREFQLPVFGIMEPTDQMRIRFVIEDGGSDSTVEAAIDDLRIQFLGCPTTNPADFNNDGTLDLADIIAFLIAYAAQNPAADLNSDGNLNFFDVSAFIIAFTNG